MPRPARIVGFGAVSIDDIYYVDAPLQAGKGRVVRRASAFGGNVATALVAASRLGADASFIGWLDEDSDDPVAAALKAEGVRTDDAPRAAGCRPVRSTITVGSDGDRFIAFDDDVRLGTAPDLSDTVLTSAGALLIDGYATRSPEIVLRAVRPRPAGDRGYGMERGRSDRSAARGLRSSGTALRLRPSPYGADAAAGRAPHTVERSAQRRGSDRWTEWRILSGDRSPPAPSAVPFRQRCRHHRGRRLFSRRLCRSACPGAWHWPLHQVCRCSGRVVGFRPRRKGGTSDRPGRGRSAGSEGRSGISVHMRNSKQSFFYIT